MNNNTNNNKLDFVINSNKKLNQIRNAIVISNKPMKFNLT